MTSSFIDEAELSDVDYIMQLYGRSQMMIHFKKDWDQEMLNNLSKEVGRVSKIAIADGCHLWTTPTNFKIHSSTSLMMLVLTTSKL
jgi:hypothetical protein